MVAAAYSIIGKRIDDAEDLTNWDAGNISTDDNPIQGAAAIGQKISSAVGAFHYTDTVTEDVSGADRRCFYVWLNSLSKLDSLVGGGLRARVGNDLSNYHEWNVAGNLEKYVGGFKKFVVSPRVTPDATVGAPDLTLVDFYGGVFDVVVGIMGNFNNTLIDAIDLLEGLRLTDGDATTPGTFAGLQLFDTGTTANQYGVILLQDGVFFLQGRLVIGDGATTTLFEDTSGAVVVFGDHVVDADFYEIRTTAGSTFNLGELVSGAAINGATILSGSALEWFLNLAAGTSNLFGSTFGQCRLVTFGAGVTTQDCVFAECGTISPAGATMTGDVVTASTDVAAMQITTPTDIANMSGISFFGNDRAIEITGTGTYEFNNLFFGGNTFDVQNNSGGAVTINISGGDTPTVENIGGSTTTVNNTVNYNLAGMNAGTEITILDRSVSMLNITGTPTALAFGDAAATERMGQSFEVAATAKAERVKINIRKVGTPTDGVILRLVNGVPGSALLAQSLEIPASTITTAFQEFDVDLTEKNSLTAATTYGIEVHRTGAVDAANYYEIEYDTGDPHTTGTRYVYNAGWSSTTGDLLFEVMEAASDNELFHVESSGITETWTHGGTARDIEVLALHQDFLPIVLLDSVGGADKDATLTQAPDRVFANP